MFGKVLRPSGFNAALVSADTSAAEKVVGVQVVRDGDFLGVVAADAWTAEQALSSIQAKWNVPSQISNQELFEYLRNHPETASAIVTRRDRTTPPQSKQWQPLM
jgi:isoquinoline 1-oxidoreductase